MASRRWDERVAARERNTSPNPAVQRTATDFSSDIDSLPEPLHTTYQKLKAELPESLEIRTGVLPMGSFGSSPALGTRLVMENQNQKPAGREKVADADANALFESLAGAPYSSREIDDKSPFPEIAVPSHRSDLSL